MNASLRIENLSVASREGPLVRDVSLEVEAGVPLTLIGETGSGKTLIAQAIAGQLADELQASGAIWINGLDVLGHPELRHHASLKLSVLPQEPWLALDPTMRASEQVYEVFRYVRGMTRSAARRATADILGSLSISGAEGRYPFQLSGGMCQRVAMAMTRAADPDILLADEPTKGLDTALRDTVVEQLQAEVYAGRALLTITHDIHVARQLGGHIAVLLEGRIVEYGPADQVLSVPRHEYTQRLVAADPALWPDVPSELAGAPVIAATGIAKSFGDGTLFSDFSIGIGAGETVALLGASGSGKTTVGNILLRLVQPDRGALWRDELTDPVRYQKIYQDPPAAFAPRQCIGDGLHHLTRRFGGDLGEQNRLLERLHLPPALLNRIPSQLSGGELQRFAILRALLVDPVFLFADEPTSRLDPLIQLDVIALLRGLVEERKIAMLLVTHDHELARKTAGRVLRLSAPDV
jgi:peptide/nickel transport system ATP-binding protein